MARIFLWIGLTLIVAINPILVWLNSSVNATFFPVVGGICMIIGCILLLLNK
jgi:hypothetical protein